MGLCLTTPLTVLQFWRDEVGARRWFADEPALDALIRDRFEATWRSARDGILDVWQETPDGALALTIVLDQFPRNMFRGTAEAFATDAQACAVANRAIARQFDLRVATLLRPFFYMPLMHAEALAEQDRCIGLLAERIGPDTTNLPYARQHRETIAKFGRFPTRNAALGRQSTPEESAYLAAQARH
jgi:uncharacterized protein (DUF924 family)